MLSAVADDAADVLFTSSLSRYSRHSVVLAGVLEFVVAHEGSILTTNFLLRPGEAFARRSPLAAANSHDPLSVLSLDRLPGLHAKYARGVLASQG